MPKNRISALFLILFLSLISTPTVIVLVDETIDITVLLSNSEEEEKGNEKKIDIEFLSVVTKEFQSRLFVFPLKNSLVYFYKKYTKPHLNIVSPPPDLHFI